MTVSIWQADDTQPVREVDVLIVGAGLAGSAAACYATQAGREVVVTEQRDIALGASSRNAGFMITGLDTYYHRGIERYGHETVREIWALSAQTHRFWRETIKNSETPVGYDECGSLLLAESEDEARDLEQAARALHADGIGVIYHNYDPLRRGYHAAIEQPWDAAVQPYELARAAFAQSGAELVANNELYGIRQHKPDTVTVYTRQFRFVAQHVLLCTNAYSPHIDPYFADKVIPTRAQCLVTAPLDKPVVGVCGYSDYGYMYYRDTFDGRLLIGGGRKLHKTLENDTSDDRITEPVQGELDKYLHAHFGDVTAPVERRWAGIMGFTPDGLPLVGSLPELPNVAFAVGFNGHGLALAAGVVERAVAFMLGGAHPGVFDAERP